MAVNHEAAGSNPAARANYGAVVYWLGSAVLNRKERDRYSPALPYAHVAPLPTKQEKGNWTENRCSTHLVCSIRMKDCGSRSASDAGSAGSTPAILTIYPRRLMIGRLALNQEAVV